jgi:cyclopropane-fatty-acyl-phospholipid synthase
MASRAEIEQHYETLGAMHALRMEEVQGEYPDYTCAFFDGDYSKTYAQAQADKHAWIFDGLGLGQDLRGTVILDIGCGWGPMLNATRRRGGSAIGLTLSSGQVEQCRRNGLDARLRDYKTLRPAELDVFDGIVSIGAFEHFCSVEEMLAGQQQEVYREFFRICAERLRTGGRLYLQTMTWGKQVPDYRTWSLDAPSNSPEAILARMSYLFPGSWLPDGLAQIVRCASGYFELVSRNNGRLDYLQTLQAWGGATRNLWKLQRLPRTLKRAVPLAVTLLTNRAAWIQYQSIRRGDPAACFAREIMSHERMFFVKTNDAESGRTISGHDPRLRES